MRCIEPPPSVYTMPDPRRGVGPYGILAKGADFAPGTLLAAYRQAIFPWPNDDAVLWCSPNPRPIFLLDRPPAWNKSVLRALKKKDFRVTVDEAFEDVLEGCSDRPEGTWIVPELAEGYRALHRLGWAHSVEVWSRASGKLVGGIYGVAPGGGVFSADSMFHRETDASKVAFASLIELLAGRFLLFDAQVPNPHLAFLGCVPIPRAEYLRRFVQAAAYPATFPVEAPKTRGF